MNNLVEAALSYAAKGYFVFPCKPRSKEPATKHGFKDATRDEAVIRGWWRENPQYNVAIATGRDSGLWVLDVDGEEGRESFLKYQSDIPFNTPNVKTPSGGFHLYFAYDEQAQKLRNSVKSVPGLDVRTEGGYVVAAGSVLEDGRYKYLNDGWREPTQAPESLLRAIRAASERRGLMAPVEATIPEGQRNPTLFSRARSLFAQGYNETEVFGAIHAVNRTRCNPPLPDEEVFKIVESAAKYNRGEMYVADTKGGFTANELMNMEIPSMQWAIPELLPEGVTVLGGKPKIGKSWLALGLCVATATGGVALGSKHVEQGDALYLALEDNKRRLQERLGKILTGEAPHNFHIHLDWPRLNEGGTDQLGQWLQSHPNARLVVIDTLAKIRKLGKGNNVYAEDYGALESLIPLAAQYNVSIVVVHHVRKMAADDPLDELNASTGLSGSVDSGLILKRAQGASDATLYVRGRDVEEQNLALRWDAQVSGWRIVGDAADFAMSDIRQRIKQEVSEAGEPLGPKEVARATGFVYEQVKKEMQRMANAEQLDKVGRGKYTVPSVPNVAAVPSVPSVPFEEDSEDERDSESNVVPFAVPVESV